MNSFSDYIEPERLSFPFHEGKLEWLSMLLDAYFEADKGVYEAISRQIRLGRSLACAKGCSHCCESHTSIPIYPLEIVGIYWYAAEILDEKSKSGLQKSLASQGKNNSCPFLIEGICSIHPMRFLACRHFNVFDKPCVKGEDAFFTRRKDVMTPIKSLQDLALSKMLPFHGITKKKDRKTALKSGYLHQQAQVLQEVDWTKLAARMG